MKASSWLILIIAIVAVIAYTHPEVIQQVQNQITQISLPSSFSGSQEATILQPNYASAGTPTSSQGILAVGVTDPPAGDRYKNTTSLLITFDSMALHNVNNDSWIRVGLNVTTVDLVQASQVEQLISTVKVPLGKYNIVRFNITQAVATVNVCQRGMENPHTTVAQSCSQQTIQLNLPNGRGVQIVILGGGIQIGTTPVHLVIDVRLNEASVLQGHLIPTWTAKTA